MATIYSSALLNGDVYVTIDIVNTTSSYVDLSIFIHSSKWTNIDVALQYAHEHSIQWNTNTSLGFVSNGVVHGNCVYGLKAAPAGAINVVRWWYSNNNLVLGSTINLRLDVLPRVASYSDNISTSMHSESYGTDLSTLRNASAEIILGKNKLGQFICVNGNTITIRATVDGSALYTTSVCVTPKHVLQLDSLHYLVADYGNGRVVEFDETLSTIIRSASLDHPVYCDYNKISDTALITTQSPDMVCQFAWSVGWHQWSYTALNTPSSATYAEQSINDIIIADTGNNRVVLYDVLMSTATNISCATMYSGEPTDTEMLSLYRPFRAFWKDDTIYVVEETGKEITWMTLNSSSSSSTSSSTEWLTSSSLSTEWLSSSLSLSSLSTESLSSNCQNCDQGACTNCDQGGCHTCDQATPCLQSDVYGWACYICDQGKCNSGDNGACTNCDQGHCTHCDQGACSGYDGTCSVCDQGPCGNGDQGACTHCDDGICTGYDGACDTCDEGQCINGDNGACSICDEGQCINGDNGICSICDEGQCIGGDNGACSVCDQGGCVSCDQGVCTNCDQGSCSNGDQGACIQCDQNSCGSGCDNCDTG